MATGGNRYGRDRRVCFESRPSQVIFDPVSTMFVVTWVKCGLPEGDRLAKIEDPLVHVPSISAIATLYDRGVIPQRQIVYAARAVGKAWRLGDRFLLDTDSAKKAAELISDLSLMQMDANNPDAAIDIGQAIRNLVDEIAAVRFMNADARSFDNGALESMKKAMEKCLSDEEFLSWPSHCKRRKFLYCLKPRERTEVAYTLVSLMFDNGSCPLLSVADKRNLRLQAIKRSQVDMDFSLESASKFFSFALSVMRDMKEVGSVHVDGKITQQQMTDIVSASSY